jgi:hypothetical protein
MNKLLVISVFCLAAIACGCGAEAPSSNARGTKPTPTPLPVSAADSSFNASNSSAVMNAANSMSNAAADSAPKSKKKDLAVNTSAANAGTSNTNNSSASAANANATGAQPKTSATATAPTQADKKDEGLFSFPPPKVTSFVKIDIAKLANKEGPTTFNDVSEKLKAALTQAKYSQEKFSYFWNDQDEFAIVTRMERINPLGDPVTGEERWDCTEYLPVAHNFSDYVHYLFSGKKVFYRVFAFVVTKKNYNFYKNTPPSFDMARDWMTKGVSELGDETSAIQSVPFDGRYHCFVLMYLFVNHTSLDKPSSVDSSDKAVQELSAEANKEAQNHLTRSGFTFGE